MPVLTEFLLTLSIGLGSVEAECLAKNVYFEARNQSNTGGIAVAQVVLNRVESKKYPNTVCGVVKQAKRTSWGTIIRHKCQFSWFCDGLSDDPKEPAEWQRSYLIAATAYWMHKVGVDLTDGSLFYHTKNVNPRWNRRMQKVMTIDDHIFWRE